MSPVKPGDIVMRDRARFFFLVRHLNDWLKKMFS